MIKNKKKCKVIFGSDSISIENIENCECENCLKTKEISKKIQKLWKIYVK